MAKDTLSSIMKTMKMLIISFFVACASTHQVDAMNHVAVLAPPSSNGIPQTTLQAFGSYPNLLNVTHEMREQFHPVVKLPKRKGWKIWAQKRITKRHQKEKAAAEEDNSNTCNSQRGLMATYDYMVKDYTLGNNSHDVMLHGGKKVPQLLLTREEALEFARTQNMKSRPFDVGRYDEDRRGMYTSTLFEDDDSRRTLHVGIDIGGPLGMKIYSFSNGVVHSLGYNDAIGDYGYVIVVEHHLNATSKCWALYGHLDANSIKGKSEGQKIDKGEVIGSIGDASENGGWTGYHLHFQLALHPPKTHDMPGVVALKDRETALLEYPDPRYVLGELY